MHTTNAQIIANANANRDEYIAELADDMRSTLVIGGVRDTLAARTKDVADATTAVALSFELWGMNGQNADDAQRLAAAMNDRDIAKCWVEALTIVLQEVA